MKLLLKQVIISDINSPYNGQAKDLLIINGVIRQIEDALSVEDAKIIQKEKVFVSPGWVDIFSHFNDPGFEYKETLESGSKAAISGGYTKVFVLPNTQPSISNKAAVEYIVQKSKQLPIDILPLASISKGVEGKELSEMYDMHQSGAVAFSDGLQPVQSPGLLLKALQYIKAINGVVVQLPLDKSISKFGLMNEGITSTRLGLPGIPAIAEELIISRDIELAKYSDSKLHITGISTARSLAIVKKARENGVNVTCSVTPFHLIFCDEDLVDYDANLKTDPPLRTRNDMMALRNAVAEEHIECIASHHLPQNWDNKFCEFEYAAPGMIGLETTFMVINSLFPDLPVDALIRLLSSNARKIFGLNNASIEIGGKAELTLFSNDEESIYETGKVKSRSGNSPFIGKSFKGKALGIINKEGLYLND